MAILEIMCNFARVKYIKRIEYDDKTREIQAAEATDK